MNNSIFNSIHSFTNAVRDDLKDAMNSFTEAELYEMNANDLVECALNNYTTIEVIYTSDAWEVVAGSQFNDFNAEYLDFSNCKNSIDCVMQEANWIIYSAYCTIAYRLACELLSDAREQYEATLDND